MSATESVTAYYARLDEANPKTNAVVQMCRDRALAPHERTIWKPMTGWRSDTPIEHQGLPPVLGVCYPAHRRLPGRDSHPLEKRSEQRAHLLQKKLEPSLRHDAPSLGVLISCLVAVTLGSRSLDAKGRRSGVKT